MTVLNITFVNSMGKRTYVEAAADMTLMEAAVSNGIKEIVAVCGGACSCATCMVHLDEEWFEKAGPVSDSEMTMIEFGVSPRVTSRLACQIVLSDTLDGLVVELPPSQT